MRIRPAVVTATGSLVALAAVATVVVTTTPQDARPAVIVLLWIAIFLASWGLLATLLLLTRQSIAQAIWASLLPSAAIVGLLMQWQHGGVGQIGRAHV